MSHQEHVQRDGVTIVTMKMATEDGEEAGSRRRLGNHHLADIGTEAETGGAISGDTTVKPRTILGANVNDQDRPTTGPMGTKEATLMAIKGRAEETTEIADTEVVDHTRIQPRYPARHHRTLIDTNIGAGTKGMIPGIWGKAHNVNLANTKMVQVLNDAPLLQHPILTLSKPLLVRSRHLLNLRSAPKAAVLSNQIPWALSHVSHLLTILPSMSVQALTMKTTGATPWRRCVTARVGGNRALSVSGPQDLPMSKCGNGRKARNKPRRMWFGRAREKLGNGIEARFWMTMEVWS